MTKDSIVFTYIHKAHTLIWFRHDTMHLAYMTTPTPGIAPPPPKLGTPSSSHALICTCALGAQQIFL